MDDFGNPRQPITLGRVLLYAICALIFGFFLLFNLAWIIVVFDAAVQILGGLTGH